MKSYTKLIGVCFWLLLSIGMNAQSGTWIWVNGTNSYNGPGNLGTQGMASANNSPQALYQCAQWTDKQGNFWIYGGVDSNFVQVSDLWKYDPTANTWTWVNGPGGVAGMPAVYGTIGIPSATNTPGNRGWGMAAWTDTSGDLWLYGGGGFDSAGSYGVFADLWRYHIASNEWTCMGGQGDIFGPGDYGNFNQFSPAAWPPSLCEANTAWTDSNNNLWMFGGYGISFVSMSSEGFNDMWRFSIALGEWAWMGGSQQANDPGNYGALGIENSTNLPPSRSSYTHWTDSNYLYFASGCNFENLLYYGDVWRFSLNTFYWTWIGGDSGTVPRGNYANYCSAGLGDQPRGRVEERSVQISGCSPTLYMWGGFADEYADTLLNDLWSFDLHTRKWHWISGSDSINPVGNCGTMGLGNPPICHRGRVAHVSGAITITIYGCGAV